ncbi:alpha/beta hydrolase, partial [Salmonella enterica subsp. enterica serovar Enteritidis]|nr:alpha/beta hydrolase [Salmonella enterica subsp. enterica serovar Enteritidis]
MAAGGQMAGSGLSGAVQRGAVRMAAAAPRWLMRAIAGKPVSVDGQTLDLQVQYLLKLFGEKPGTLASVDETRKGFDTQGSWLSQPQAPGVAVEALTLKGPAGVVPARLYRPKGLPAAAPSLVFYHGGGHVAGSLDSHDLPCRALARDAGCIVIAIDYRL